MSHIFASLFICFYFDIMVVITRIDPLIIYLFHRLAVGEMEKL